MVQTMLRMHGSSSTTSTVLPGGAETSSAPSAHGGGIDGEHWPLAKRHNWFQSRSSNVKWSSLPWSATRPATDVASLPMVNVATSHCPSTRPSSTGSLTSDSSLSRASDNAAKLSNL